MKIKTIFVSMLLVVLFATTAFAATKTWVEKEDGWHYIDADGNEDSCYWVGKTYYINEDYVMAVNSLIEDEDNFYYVAEDGKKVRNAWVKTVKEEDEDPVWMYFMETGKAFKEGEKKIDGKTYCFDNFEMLTGWVADGETIADEDLGWMEAQKYFGEDGAMVTGWVKVFDENSDAKWIWLNDKGVKFTNGTKLINGVKYVFGANGAIEQDTFIGTVSDATPANYVDANGGIVKSGWVWATSKADNTDHWFYLMKDGTFAKNCVKKINDKYYAFDTDGHMLTGFVWVMNTYGNTPTFISKAEDIAENWWEIYVATGYLMYFAENENPALQGAAATGKTIIDCGGIAVTMNFNQKGMISLDPANEWVVKKNYMYNFDTVYDRGYQEMLKPDALMIKYTYFDLADGKKYIVNCETGKAYTKGTFKDNESETGYRFDANGNVIKIVKKDGKWVDAE